MNSDIETTATEVQVPAPPVSHPWLSKLTTVLVVISVIACLLLWQRLADVKETLIKQAVDSGSLAQEARASARQAEELARDNAARLSQTDAKLSEVVLQRTQLEELMQSLSRSRDENMLMDIDSSLRLALQQAQLTGSAQPLVAALRNAEQRLAKQPQPRLAPVQRAITRDLDRVKALNITDTPGLLIKLDELARQADDLPLTNAAAAKLATTQADADQGWSRAINLGWLDKILADIWQDIRSLVRINRIDQPEASLLAPDQSYFLRENLKLRLLNARLGLLSRQFDAARSDLFLVQKDLQRYFDKNSNKVKSMIEMLLQIQQEVKQVEIPRLDDTFSALSTVTAGR
jgi:uroporphyrin-3 C-methyltransferase